MIISAHRLGEIRRRHAGETIVLANGVFDLFHVGHLRYLKRARQLGDILVVKVLADKHTAHLKGENRPIMNQRERIAFIEALGLADYIVRNPVSRDIILQETVKKLRPDIFASRSDLFGLHTAAKLRKEFERISPATRFVVIPQTRGISTSKIIERIMLRVSDNGNGSRLQQIHQRRS